MNDELSPVEEQALDSLLAETLAGAAPPDLTAQILEKWHENPTEDENLVDHENLLGREGPSGNEGPREVAPIVETEASLVRESRSSSPRHIGILITAMAALAATWLMAVWLRSDPELPDPAPTVAEANAAPERDLIASEQGNTKVSPIVPPAAEAPSLASPRKTPRGIPLVIGSDSSDETPVDSDVQDVPSPSTTKQLDAVMLVSRKVDSELRDYWRTIGIEPGVDAGGDEVVARLALVLGTKLSVESIRDPERLQAELSRPKVSLAIADRWLQLITEGGSMRANEQARQSLVDELAACFQEKREFDRTLAAWIAGESGSAPGFYAAIASGPKHANDNSAMIRRLAALTMNVDLRCTRCHDSYIEGNGRHEDFVAFTAFLRRGVTRDRDGNLTIDGSTDSAKPVFYELADGRQRVTEAAVAGSWMKDRSGRPIKRVNEWTESLIGSEELARGVVNSLWQLVHGQPLQGRVVDPISAPHNESLDVLEESLVHDLTNSRFNLARTLALIISSPATHRAVPEALLPENALAASGSDVEAAKNAVNAFAAAQPPRSRLPMRDRLAQAMRAAGATLNTDGSVIVAQIGSDDGKRGSREAESDPLAADFPSRSMSLPVQWLDSIKDQESQVEHLAYLAGMSEMPADVVAVAKTSESASDRTTALNRVWWLLRP